MAITHSFVSGKADGGDATLVRPSNWNADHAGSPNFLEQLVTSISVSTTLDTTHSIVLGTAGAGGITATLPTAVGIAGRQYVIKKIDAAAGSVIVDGNGAETIDGEANYELVNQWQYVHVYSDGTNWVILANN